MNAKKAKKFRKEVRKSIGSGIDTMRRISRKKPRFIPLPIWVLIAYWPLFKIKHIKRVYVELKKDKS